MSRQGKKRPRTITNVKDFWNKEASSWGTDPRVTIRDHYFRLLEIETVRQYIQNRHRVLDIGCGTGFSSLFYAQEVDELVGVDYAEKMIENSQKFLSDKKYFTEIMQKYTINRTPTLRRNIRFETGNILDIVYRDYFFDTVITERVLINLPTYQQQYKGMKEVVRILSKRGLWVLVEVTQQGHKQIDKMRNLFGLPPIEKYWHNLYLNEPSFEKRAKSIGLRIQKKMYFESYQFLTKIIHPLVTASSEPHFMTGFNKAAFISASQYPEYADIKKIGLKTFLKNFRENVKKFDSQRLDRYDAILPVVLEKEPDFFGCSHQVLYVFDKIK